MENWSIPWARSIYGNQTFVDCEHRAPTQPHTDFAIETANDSTLRVSWAKGDGQYSILLMREGAEVDTHFLPEDGNLYADYPYYDGSGLALGHVNYVVYSGADTQVEVSGLTPDSAYYFVLIAFNADGPCINYLLDHYPSGAGTPVVGGGGNPPTTTEGGIEMVMFAAGSQVHIKFGNEEAAQGWMGVYKMDGEILNSMNNTAQEVILDYSNQNDQILLVRFVHKNGQSMTRKVLIR